MEGSQPYYNFDLDGYMLNLAYSIIAISQNEDQFMHSRQWVDQMCNSLFAHRHI